MAAEDNTATSVPEEAKLSNGETSVNYPHCQDGDFDVSMGKLYDETKKRTLPWQRQNAQPEPAAAEELVEPVAKSKAKAKTQPEAAAEELVQPVAKRKAKAKAQPEPKPKPKPKPAARKAKPMEKAQEEPVMDDGKDEKKKDHKEKKEKKDKKDKDEKKKDKKDNKDKDEKKKDKKHKKDKDEKKKDHEEKKEKEDKNDKDEKKKDKKDHKHKKEKKDEKAEGKCGKGNSALPHKSRDSALSVSFKRAREVISMQKFFKKRNPPGDEQVMMMSSDAVPVGPAAQAAIPPVGEEEFEALSNSVAAATVGQPKEFIDQLIRAALSARDQCYLQAHTTTQAAPAPAASQGAKQPGTSHLKAAKQLRRLQEHLSLRHLHSSIAESASVEAPEGGQPAESAARAPTTPLVTGAAPLVAAQPPTTASAGASVEASEGIRFAESASTQAEASFWENLVVVEEIDLTGDVDTVARDRLRRAADAKKEPDTDSLFAQGTSHEDALCADMELVLLGGGDSDSIPSLSSLVGGLSEFPTAVESEEKADVNFDFLNPGSAPQPLTPSPTTPPLSPQLPSRPALLPVM